ncbi:DUF1127 domain-containing protein [Pseudomonas sp. NPDC089530]|uniref:DUF1127 domain-containing protein n=1 Tax=Pseudomonas sp. NPDC089530 TaxID=3390651 RepID=UPI003D0750D5
MKGQKGYVLAHRFPWHELALRSLLHRMVRWHALHRERLMLAGMSDEALKDIGLSRADVEQESVRPFWDDPMHK